MNEPGQKAELKQLLEKRDSIKVSRTATGKFSFEVKRYYDFDKTKPDDVIKQIAGIYEELEKRFSG
jgi:hypothetical protein